MKHLPAAIREKIWAWRYRQLQLGIGLMFQILSDEQEDKFWEIYDRHAPELNPAPPCVVVEDEPQEPTGRGLE